MKCCTCSRKLLQWLYLAFLTLAWVAWVLMLAGIAVVTKEWQDIVDRQVTEVAEDKAERDLEYATDFTWTIVWLLFVILIFGIVAAVIGLKNTNRKSHHTWLRLILALMVVVLGWMGNENQVVSRAQREAHEAEDTLGPIGNTSPLYLPGMVSDDFEEGLSVLLAGYTVMFIALFVLIFVIIWLISIQEDEMTTEGVQGGKATVHEAAAAPVKDTPAVVATSTTDPDEPAQPAEAAAV